MAFKGTMTRETEPAAAMKHERVVTPHAPAPIGPYSQAIRSAASSSAAVRLRSILRPATSSTATPARRPSACSSNLGAVLCAAGYHFDDVVKTTIFLVDMNDFPAVNEVYERYFGASKPARSTVAVAALPRGARVEIDCIAKD